LTPLPRRHTTKRRLWHPSPMWLLDSCFVRCVTVPGLLAALAWLPMTACVPAPPAVVSAAEADETFAASTKTGPWAVHQKTLRDGHELYLPSTTTQTTDRTLYPLPLVVFTPGFSASPTDYEESLLHLASHGFAVLGVRHGFDFVSATFCTTQADGYEKARDALNEVRRLSRTPRAENDLYGLVDERAAVGAVGHSYGGKLALWLASDGNGVGAVIALDPVDGGDDRRPGYCAAASEEFARIAPQLDDPDLPPTLMIVAGLSGDCAPQDGNGEVLFAALANDGLLLRLPAASHTDFVDAAGGEDCALCGLCPPSEEDGAAVLRLVRGATVSFLRHRLQNDSRERRWLVAGDVVDGSVDVTVVRKP
jgi:predicted dienelactone hydrolase